ncbi:MAG TPA: hypothetical protein VE955_10420 [Candidatus Dormibacteraeota bacterium]|jgi:hypothetical protein|nr:hypothetical protein [Candidatus Dormibacteraeota bacterium]
MGLLDHLRAPKGKIWITFDKPTFMEGEGVTGKVNIEASEYIQSLGVKVEARVFENYQEMVWVTVNNQRFQENQHKQDVLFSRDVQVSGPNDFGSGPTQTFPFSVGMPAMRARRPGGSIQNSLKAVVQVKGRPDMTSSTQVAFTPPGSMPQQMPGYMPGAYPMPQGYGPPGYNQGYNPNPGYNPAYNPGYGGPAGPGYGPPMPGYNMPPQQPMPEPAGPQVRCKYCQGLMNQSSSTCPNCGAHQ